MNVACSSVCDGHVSERHSRCQGGPWNERLRYPNFISGYTGKIPINLRWDGSENLWETRDFHSGCKEPGKSKILTLVKHKINAIKLFFCNWKSK